jgi:hypothetical protein
VVEGRQRYDLALPTKDDLAPCQRPAVEGCSYLVEVQFGLLQAGREDLVERLTEMWGSSRCNDYLRFATTYGLEDFRAMRERVDAEIDEVYRFYGPAISRYFESDHWRSEGFDE